MASQGPRLRGGWTSPAPYPLGQIPNSVILSIASSIVYLSAVGRADIAGDDWGDIFAAALNAHHLKSPLGIVDIALGNTAWSAKTVKSSKPAAAKTVRLISGRNAPVFSFGTADVFANIQETGRQVLSIWNARVSEATESYSQLRTIALMRNMEQFTFKVFELPTSQFDPADYVWTLNKKRNLEGRSIVDNRHSFTWQPSGGQFTIIRPVSGSARSFRVKKPEALNPQDHLAALGYSDDWVTLL